MARTILLRVTDVSRGTDTSIPLTREELCQAAQYPHTARLIFSLVLSELERAAEAARP